MTALGEYNLRISKSFSPQIKEILRIDCSKVVTHVFEASDYDDANNAIDFNIGVYDTSVGGRVRIGLDCFKEHHQFTLRTSLPSGLKTEIDKVREGSPRWYLYCWSDKGKITHWIFMDIDIFRKRAISIPDSVHIKNVDGSTFSGWDIVNLYGYGCIVNASKPVMEYIESQRENIPILFME